MTHHLLKIFTILLIISIAGTALAQKRPQGNPPRDTTRERPQTDKITINFVDVDIATVIRFISEITGKNFIFDERVKGKVTIIAPSKLSKDEAFNLFTSVLELKGFTILPTANVYKIIPSSIAKQSGIEIVKKPDGVNEAYIVRLIPLNFISAREALPFFQPLVSKDGHISAFGPGNTLLVVDTALNIEKILDILKAIDIEQEVIQPEIVYLKYAQAEVVAQMLRQDAFKKGPPTPTTPRPTPPVPEVARVIPDTRLNALVLLGSPAEREEDKRLIALLDVPPPEASSRINVYYLENADAVELAKVLEGILKAPPPGQPPGAIPPPGQPPGAVYHELAGRVAVTPDKATNSLIIMASPADYQNLIQIVKQLDRRPRQVFVEAMIAEVSIDKLLELGTRWRATARSGGEPVVVGGVGTIDISTIQSIISGLAGLTVGGIGNLFDISVTQPDGTTTTLTIPGFALLFSLSEFEGAVNVLSTPHILTSDNKEAEIIVGENVPFRAKLERESTTTAQPLLQSIERKDVGITLRLTPQISEGDYVKLNIYQEISAIASTPTLGGVEAADIITTKRAAKSQVVVKDKQTIVIGGLIQDKDIETLNKVPLLGDIPLLGWLFKFKSNKRQKTNLMVFLTPKIVKEFEDLEELKRDKEKEFRERTGDIQRGGDPQPIPKNER